MTDSSRFQRNSKMTDISRFQRDRGQDRRGRRWRDHRAGAGRLDQEGAEQVPGAGGAATVGGQS